MLTILRGLCLLPRGALFEVLWCAVLLGAVYLDAVLLDEDGREETDALMVVTTEGAGIRLFVVDDVVSTEEEGTAEEVNGCFLLTVRSLVSELMPTAFTEVVVVTIGLVEVLAVAAVAGFVLPNAPVGAEENLLLLMACNRDDPLLFGLRPVIGFLDEVVAEEVLVL